MAAVVFSFVNLDGFLAITQTINDWILKHFSWLFSLGSLYLLLLTVVTYFSPLANIRIGGENAKPLLSKPRWFMITLCTTLAVGMLLWSTAEPIYHFNSPPVSFTDLQAGSADAALFSMSAVFLHWSFTPYAIYAVPSLVFALAFYNKQLPFSISSSLAPVFGKLVVGKTRSQVIDTLAMYSLVTGMAASLGTGAITLVGGIGEFSSITATPFSLGVAVALVVGTFVASAASGLHKGIARLSALNAGLLLLIGAFVFLFGPTLFILILGVESIGEYLSNFFKLSLFTGGASGDSWPQDWSVFYWAVWFAWAPVSALFLGRIARGYTVREFLQINLIFPSLFAIAWLSIFAGTSINIDMVEGGIMNTVLTEQGLEKLLYYVFDSLPFSCLMTAILVFVAFISYVTAADSNTDAIGNLCTKGVTLENVNGSSVGLKVIWGVIIGLVAWIMISFVGIDGVKMLSNLGGLPALIIILATSLTLIKWLKHPETL
jgi:choline-glycine betaine transporter